jgi:hypothetical protein
MGFLSDMKQLRKDMSGIFARSCVLTVLGPPAAIIDLSAYAVKRATGSSPEEARGGLGLTEAAFDASSWVAENAGEKITDAVIKAAIRNRD